MRRRWLVLVLLGFVATTGRAAEQAGVGPIGPSPAEIVGARYYSAAFAAEVLNGTLQLHFFWNSRPISVFFPAAGQVEIDWGREIQTCQFSANGGPSDYQLAMDCGGAPRLASWSWVGEGRVRTDLAADEPELMEMVPKPFAEIRAEFESKYRNSKLAELAGLYRDASGNEIVINPEGTLTMAGRTHRFDVVECLNRVGTPGMPNAACLRVEGDVPGHVLGALPADAGAVLVEGTLTADSAGTDPAFRTSPNARRYFRVP